MALLYAYSRVLTVNVGIIKKEVTKASLDTYRILMSSALLNIDQDLFLYL
jgi:hypothetical protein